MVDLTTAAAAADDDDDDDPNVRVVYKTRVLKVVHEKEKIVEVEKVVEVEKIVEVEVEKVVKVTEKPQCCLCMDEDACFAITPCGHVCICETCVYSTPEREGFEVVPLSFLGILLKHEAGYNRHYRKVHDPKWIVCLDCDKEFVHMSVYQTHKCRKKLMYECEYCHTGFTRFGNKEQHQQKVQGVVERNKKKLKTTPRLTNNKRTRIVNK